MRKETTKEAAERMSTRIVEMIFEDDTKWQQVYSEEEVYSITQQLKLKLKSGVLKWQDDFEFDLEEWFEQFKKK